MSAEWLEIEETALKVGDRVKLWSASEKIRVITSIMPYKGPLNGCVGIAYCDNSDFGFSLWPGQTVFILVTT